MYYTIGQFGVKILPRTVNFKYKEIVSKIIPSCYCIVNRNASTYNSNLSEPCKLKLSSLYSAYNLKQIQIQSYSTRSVQKCWHCEHISAEKLAFCIKCKIIQCPDENENYFSIFELHEDFIIDTKLLTKKFRALQAVYHPDKFTQKSVREQQLSASNSSLVNKAYRSLLHPVSRAEYMLALTGRTLMEEEITLDQDFLLSIMEVNEALAQATDEAAVAIVAEKSKQMRDELLSAAGDAFRTGDIEKAREMVAMIKYYENIYNKVIEYERSHGIVT